MLHKLWWTTTLVKLFISIGFVQSFQDNWNSKSELLLDDMEEWNNDRVKREIGRGGENDIDYDYGSGSGIGPLEDDEDSFLMHTTSTTPIYSTSERAEDISETPVETMYIDAGIVEKGNVGVEENLTPLGSSVPVSISNDTELSLKSEEKSTVTETALIESSTQNVTLELGTLDMDVRVTAPETSLTESSTQNASLDLGTLDMDFRVTTLPNPRESDPPLVILNPWEDTNETITADMFQPGIENESWYPSLRAILAENDDIFELEPYSNNTNPNEIQLDENNSFHFELDIFLFCVLCLIILLILLFCMYVVLYENRKRKHEELKSKPTLVTYIPNSQNEEIHFNPEPSNNSILMMSNEPKARNSLQWVQNVCQLPMTDEVSDDFGAKDVKYKTMTSRPKTVVEQGSTTIGDLNISSTSKKSKSLEDILTSSNGMTMKLNGKAESSSRPLTFLQKYGVTANRNIDNLTATNSMKLGSSCCSSDFDDNLEEYGENYQPV